MTTKNYKEIIGVVAISHCRVAEEMLRAAELITGPLEACRALSLQADQPVEQMAEQVRDAIKEVDHGNGVLILTDLFGGTPANISLSFLGPKIEVVCGMNLPMLIKLVSCRTGYPLKEVASLVKEYGQRHISLASEVLARSGKAS
jgi:mannose PTS system EIIA component